MVLIKNTKESKECSTMIWICLVCNIEQNPSYAQDSFAIIDLHQAREINLGWESEEVKVTCQPYQHWSP